MNDIALLLVIAGVLFATAGVVLDKAPLAVAGMVLATVGFTFALAAGALS